jgi:gliotoxin/aspirochlorine biosynthesis aminotransferase
MPFATMAIVSLYRVHTGVCPLAGVMRTLHADSHCADGYTTTFKVRSRVDVVVAHPPTYVNFDNYLLASLQAAYDFAADRSRIKAVVLCNPHNPLSRCYPKKAIVECMEFCQEHGLHLISDELFALMPLEIASEGAPPFTSALSLTEPLVPEGAVKVDPSRVHVIWSASKLFGSHAFRVVILLCLSVIFTR